jgi:hypothetical protein
VSVTGPCCTIDRSTTCAEVLACDFIAYAYAPAATCVLLPVPAFERAWRQHGRQWIGLYGTRRAANQGYTSVSVPVPRGVLMQAIVEAMLVS